MDLNNTKNTLRTNTTMLYGTHFALIPSSLTHILPMYIKIR